MRAGAKLAVVPAPTADPIALAQAALDGARSKSAAVRQKLEDARAVKARAIAAGDDAGAEVATRQIGVQSDMLEAREREEQQAAVALEAAERARDNELLDVELGKLEAVDREQHEDIRALVRLYMSAAPVVARLADRDVEAEERHRHAVAEAERLGRQAEADRRVGRAPSLAWHALLVRVAIDRALRRAGLPDHDAFMRTEVEPRRADMAHARYAAAVAALEQLEAHHGK